MTDSIDPTKHAAESVNDSEKKGTRNEYLDDSSLRQSFSAEVKPAVISDAPHRDHGAAAATTAASLHSDSCLDSPAQHRMVQNFMREQVFDPNHLDIIDSHNDPYAVAALPWKLWPDGHYRPIAPGTWEAREAMRIREVQLNVILVHEGSPRCDGVLDSFKQERCEGGAVPFPSLKLT